MSNILRSPKLLAVLSFALVAGLTLFFIVGRPKREAIRIVTPPTIIASLPHWIAEQNGYYTDEGLEVRTISLTNSSLMVQAITSNDADVLPAVSLVDVINGQSQALDRPLIFSHSRMRSNPPFESLVVLAGSTVKSLKDLEGQRIAVYPGATAMECVKLYLGDKGVDISKVTFRPLPPPEHIPALQRGDAEASHIYDPQRSQALEGNLCRELVRGVYPSFNEPSAIGVSAISARFAQEHPKAATKYLRAWNRAITLIRENPDEARLILAKRLNLTPQIAASATWVDATLSSELDPEMINRTIETVRKLGRVPKDFDPTSGAHLFQPR
jgi:ABC-type nitrate/sulfonate/bicarbonate transport system substrate-binding protein